MKNVLSTTFCKHEDFHNYCESIGVSISQKTISSILKWERGKFQEGKVLGFAKAQIERIQKAIEEYESHKTKIEDKNIRRWYKSSKAGS